MLERRKIFWHKFMSRARNKYSLYFFSILFVLSLFAEIISNDKPIIMSLDEQIYFPIMVKYTDKELGGYFDTEADYKDDFIFFDPPYVPLEGYADFKRYTKEQFHLDDQVELSKYYKKLDKKGCYLILTNSNHEIIKKFYNDFKIKIIKTKRNINSKGSKRTGEDIVITNF